MKKSPDLHLFLLKKVHGWCKRNNLTYYEMYFQCTFREFLQRYGMLLTKIETRNNQHKGHHTFTFTPAPGAEIFEGTDIDLESVLDTYYSGYMNYFEYEETSVIRNHKGIISIRCYYLI